MVNKAKLRARARERHKIRTAANPEYYRLKNKGWSLKKTYGITLEQYNNLIKDQNGLCACCGDLLGLEQIHVDHDHRTGRIRGVLCGICNRGLGQFKDSASRLEHALVYLNKNNAH